MSLSAAEGTPHFFGHLAVSSLIHVLTRGPDDGYRQGYREKTGVLMTNEDCGINLRGDSLRAQGTPASLPP